MVKKIWTSEEIDILKRMYPDHFAKEIAAILGRNTPSVYCKAMALGLESSREKIARAGSMSAHHPNAVAARYKKGHVPFNPGRKMSPEVYERAKATMFQKGQKPHNHRPVGSERINVDGYLEVKVAEPGTWRLKHRIVWEQYNGQIPDGCNVQFRNHDKTDVRIENLYLITRSEQMRSENSFYSKYPKEIQEVIHLKGVVNRIIHKQQRQGYGK